jgi:hypothetical protein
MNIVNFQLPTTKFQGTPNFQLPTEPSATQCDLG